MYEIRKKENIYNLESDIGKLMMARFKNKCGIIYCVARKECEKLAETLKRNYNVKCEYYHADMNYKRRQEIQRQWMSDEIQVIIATIAFGMGINKQDVRFVIHAKLPKNLEGYVQECGRAGRDQEKAECILYYSYGDRSGQDYHIGRSNPKLKE